MPLKLVGFAAGLMMLAACGSSTSPYGGGGGGGGGGGRSTTITVGNNFFSPTPDTVPAGTVTFSWSTPSNGHTVTWDSGPGTLPTDTGIMTSGTYAPTVQVGTYHYHCSQHPGMTGVLVVQ